MQNSDQSPEEQQPGPASAESTRLGENQPETGSVPTHSANASAPSSQSPADHSAIQQGLIYPPPPSFYQQAEAKPGAAPQPERAQETPRAFENAQREPAGDPWGTPPPGYPRYTQGPGYPQPGLQAPPYYPVPAPTQPATQARGWYRALWIVLSLVILTSCGLCVWSSTAYFSFVSNQVEKSGTGQTVINNFYDALQNKNYTEAYGYLHPQDAISGLTQNQFTQDAQKADAQDGDLLSYTQGTQQVNSSNGTITFAIDVAITRQHAQYTTHLTIGLVGSSWKILSYNRL